MSRLSAVTLLAIVALSCCALLLVAASAPRHHRHHRPSVPHSAPAAHAADPLTDESVSAKFMARWREQRLQQQLNMEKAATAALADFSWQYGQNNYTMQRPEGVRNWYLYVPRSYTASSPMSLVLAIHGLGDNALHFSTRTNITDTAEAYGFLAIYPQGTTSPLGTSWNAGTCCADRTVDDVAFLTAIVSLVSSSMSVRADSIHSFGFSNGGFMTERLGCERSNMFTSIASVSGDTILLPGNAGALTACDAAYSSPTSILHIHGNADFIVPWTGDSLLGFPSVPDDMAAWTKRNRCPGPPVQTLNEGTFTNQLWSACGFGNTTVELVLNNGGGHEYIMNNVTGGFDTTNYILQFWNAVTPGGL